MKLTRNLLLWLLVMALALTPISAKSVLPEVSLVWDDSHTQLTAQGDLGAARYGVLAFYRPNGQMMQSRLYTALELQEGVTVTHSDFVRATAQLFYLSHTVQPLYHNRTEEGFAGQPEDSFLCWLYATDLGYIDSVNGSHLASGGKLLFSDGQRMVILPARGTGLTEWDLGRPFRIQFDPDNGEVLWIEALDIAREASGPLMLMESRQAEGEILFSLGDLVDVPLNGDAVPLLTLTHEQDVPRQITGQQLQELVQQGWGSTDLYAIMDREGDGDIDYLMCAPVSYGRVTAVDVSKKYGPYIRITDWQGQDVKNLYSKKSRNLYLEDDCRYPQDIQPGDVVRFYTEPVEGYRQVDKLACLSGLCTAIDEQKGLAVIDGQLFALAQKAFGQPLQAGRAYELAVDGAVIVWAEEQTP